ncbi:MAG: toprim domain-containing protein, partial [Sedimentisphaerales bacterium]|nr:toprim domain-containing protein [Sedimentisphaerales bacterium]
DHNTPNLIVSPDKGLWHCMACGLAGNCIQFVQKYDGVSFRHAFEILNEGPAAYSAPENHPNRWGTDEATRPMKRTTVRRLDSPLKPDAEDVELLDQVVDYYHERLLKTPLALEYLKSRGLYHEEAIERFRLGYADRTLGLRLPERNRKEGKAIRERLIKLGLIRETGHEHFNGSVIVPVFDEHGHVAEMYGRKNRKVTPPSLPHLYLPGPHAGIWNVEALAGPDVILCEAPFDALTFWVNGIRNVTFTFGNEGFPKYLFDALLSHRVKRVHLAYDADKSGERAAKRDTERLSAHGIQVYRVKFPWGMDVNDYALKVTPAAKSLRVAVDSAEWVGGKVDAPRSTRTGAPTSSNESLAANKLAAEFSSSEAPSPGEKAKEEAANEKSESVPSEKSVVEPSPTLTRQGEYHTLTLGKRHYRVGGLDKNNSLEVLKVAVRIRYEENFHLDSFDMTRDGERRRFIERAAEETGLEKELIKRDLGRLLLALEEAQQQRLNAAVETGHDKTPDMTADERSDAFAFLKASDLVKKINAAFDDYGLVGEHSKRLAAYLSCTSRLLDKPLAVIIQSSTAAGKTALMEAVLAMFPEEERVKYSAMTGQSLFYLGETDLKHKILAIVEEEGAEKASYALKLLQSEGELTIASTGKNPQTGRMETQEYHVEGPVMIFLTTTAIEIDEELQNRCLMLTVDESREQTERIHALQRKERTLEGLRIRKKRKRLLTLLRNAQRLLQPVDVVNPWADQLTFTTERTRTRRDNLKYLGLIEAITLLHQYQRRREKDEDDSPFIRVTLDDIALANQLAPELLGRSLDELPPQTRHAYEAVKQIVLEQCDEQKIEQRFAFFSRKDLRERLGWSLTQVRVHLERLRQFEYITARYGRPGSAFQYELLTDCREPSGHVHIGLLDVEKLRVRRQPDGKIERVTEGWRGAPRQVQTVAEPALAANLTA